MPRDLFAEQEERKKSEPRDLFAERGISITPEKPAEPEGSNLVRGFTSYGPQLKETFGGAKVLAGKALGSEALMKSGIESMEEAKQTLRAKSKSTDSFTTALDKGIGTVLTEWLPYQIGSGAGNLLESLAVMGAGAAVGSAVAPGAGTIGGGMFGLVEKELLKKSVKEAAEKILKESGEEVAKKFVEQKTAEAVKTVARNVAATSALAAQAGFHGAGETTSRAVEEAQRLGKEATDIEMGRVVPAAIVHGVAEFVGDKIGLGAFNKLDLNQKNLLLNFSKNLVVTGTKEAPVEMLQSAAERFGAKLSLTDAEAIKEYVDSAAAAYAMSIVPSAGGAVKTRGMAGLEERNKELEAQFRQDIQQEEADAAAASQKADAAAQDITKVGVPDEQGNVAPLQPIKFDVMAPDEIAAAEAATAAQDKDVTAAIPEQTVPKENQAITELVGDAYAEHGTGKKVLETLKPQLEAMGIPAEEHKKVIEEARTALNIPRNDTKEGRAAMPVWAQQWPTQKESLNVPTTINAEADQSSITSAPREVGGTPTRTEAPDVSGMVDTGGDVAADNVAEGTQPAALTEDQVKVHYDNLIGEVAGAHNLQLPSWEELTPAEREAATKEAEDAQLTKGMTPSKGKAAFMSPAMAAIYKSRIDKQIESGEIDLTKAPQPVIDLYEEERGEWGERNAVRTVAWDGLSTDEKAIYLNNIRKNSIEERNNALDVLTDYREAKAPRGASFYENNREAYNKDMPEWASLHNDEREAFLKAIEPGLGAKTAKPKVTTEQMDAGFKAVVDKYNKRTQRRVERQTEVNKGRDEQAQKEREEKQRQESEQVDTGHRLPKSVILQLFNGDIKGVLKYLSQNAKGMAYAVERITGKRLDEKLNNFRAGQAAISRGVFRQLSKVLGAISYDTKVVMEESNAVVKQLRKEGKLAAYDPKTDTLYFTNDGLDEQTVLHEITHAGTVKILYKYKTDPNSLTQEQREAAEHIEKIYEFAKSRLSGKHRFAFENVYEFVSYAMTDVGLQRDLAGIQARGLGKYTPENKPFLRSILSRFGSLWGQFTQALMKMYGLTKAGRTFVASESIPDDIVKGFNELPQEELGGLRQKGVIYQRPASERVSKEAIARGSAQAGYEANLLVEMSEAFGRILAVPEAGIDIEALPARKPKAAPTTDRSVEELEAEMKTGKQIATPSKIWDAILSGKAGPWLERKFANDRAPIKRWQKQLADAGRVIAYGVGMNNIYDQIVLSAGNAHYIYTQYVQAGTEGLRQEIAAYADKNKISVEKALEKLAMYSIARHLPERRETLYMKDVDLSVSPIIKFTNAQGKTINISPSQMRDEIFKELNTNINLTKAEKAYFEKTLRSIVFDKNQTFLNPNIKGKDLANINSSKYNVAGAFSESEVKTMMDAYNANKAEVQPIFDIIDKLNKTTLKLNKMSNYMSPYAQNWIDFYGWKNYVPLKGKHLSDETDMLNFDSRRLGGELQEKIHAFEGNQELPDNPILQVMADAAIASMRVGRKNITETIYNSAKKSKDNPNGSGLLQTAEVIKIVNFEERNDQKFLDSLGGETKIFHYMPDGKVAVISIKDKLLLESIRRTYKEVQPLRDFFNKWTGRLGQTHTRFNIAFAPVNFVRDVLTNAFTIGADMGPLKSFNYLGAVAKDVATGKFWKTIRFNYLYSEGRISAIRALGMKNPYYKDLLDLTRQGGRVSSLAGFANKGQFNELNKEVGKSGIVPLKSVAKFFDGYIEMFEMASRVAAFRIAKETELAELKRQNKTGPEAEKAARIKAASYTKELANFEQTGEFGKTMGAWFMFFRPSATGAVRAIDAVAPALMNAEQARMRQPQFAEAAALREKLKDKSITGVTRTNLETKLKSAEKAISYFDSKFAENKQNAQIMIICLMGMGAATYAMAHAMADDDDEKDELGRNKIATDDMSRWTKFARFYIPGIERPIQIPWGFGLGAFAALGAQLAAIGNGNVRTGDALANMLMITLDSFLPLPFSRIPASEKPLEFLLDSAFPSIARPLIEFAFNLDPLGRQIYNNRQSRFGDAYTGGDNIPELYKIASRYWFDTTGDDVSPNTLYFFANSYADGASRLMHDGTNIGLWLSGQKDFDPKTDTVFFSSFVGSKSNYDAREWQRIDDDLSERSKKLSMLKDKPEKYYKYLEDNPLDAMLVKMYNHDVGGYLKDLRAQANKYRAMDSDKLSLRERKEIVDSIVQRENFEKYRLVQLYNAYGVKP